MYISVPLLLYIAERTLRTRRSAHYTVKILKVTETSSYFILYLLVVDECSMGKNYMWVESNLRLAFSFSGENLLLAFSPNKMIDCFAFHGWIWESESSSLVFGLKEFMEKKFGAKDFKEKMCFFFIYLAWRKIELKKKKKPIYASRREIFLCLFSKKWGSYVDFASNDNNFCYLTLITSIECSKKKKKINWVD